MEDNRITVENLAGQVMTTAWGCYIAYGYNNCSELTNAVAAVDADYRYAYGYDDIGNRETSSERGTNSVYTANQLNQYTEISDSAPSASPRETFTSQFDDDGNQTLIKTATGIWSVTYNGENRPVQWSNSMTNITMKFDRMGRRVEYLETVENATNTHHRFVYDGYLCIQRLDALNGNAAELSFGWDPTEPIATRPLRMQISDCAQNLFYFHDGNKNVSDIISCKAEQGVVAHYEYSPFGAVVEQSGAIYELNPIRFSSEYADETLGLINYNFRHYNTLIGRWVNRDLVEELGGVNIYCFVYNDPLIRWDYIGLLDSDLQDYVKRNFSTEIKAFASVGGGITLLLTHESGKHCCVDGSHAGQVREISEWTIGGNVAVGVGFGVDFQLLGVGFEFQITFASAELDILTAHVILDDCKDDVYADVDLLNVRGSPGVKEASIGLGKLGNLTLSVYGGFELTLGARVSKEGVSPYGGIYFDYDFSLSGSLLWHEYEGYGIDDLAPHQRITLVEFGQKE